MKPTTKLRRAPRRKEGETEKSYQARLRAYERDKAIRDYERNSPSADDDAAITPEQAAIIERVEKESLLLSQQDPEWEEEMETFLTKHHEDHHAERRAAIVASPTGKPEPKETPSSLDPLLSRLDELLERVGGLETLVDKLGRLVAVTVPKRTLKPAAKAVVLELAPELVEAFKDERVRELYETYEHVVNMGRDKKITANFPVSLRGEYVRAGVDNTEIVCRVIPHSALIARCAAKKVFRAMEDEESSVENVKLALAKSGLIVTTMHAAGLKRGSLVKVVMDHAEAVKRGLVKGLPPIDTSKPVVSDKPPTEAELPYVPVTRAPKAVFDKAAWEEADDEITVEEIENDEPVAAPAKKGNPRFAEWDDESHSDLDIDPAPEDCGGTVEDGRNTTTTVDPAPTTPTVDEEIDTEPWEEEEEQPEEGFALFRTPEEPPKSSKIVDLFAD